MSTIHHHPLDNLDVILKFLAPHMPTCIALYQRLQFENFTPTSHILTSLSPTELTQSVSKPWIIAFVDRSSRPETEVWITASWETSPPSPQLPPQAATLVTALVQELKALGLETQVVAGNAVSDGNTDVVDGAVGRKQYEAYLSNSDIILFGAVHETTIDVLKTLGYIAPGYVGVDIPYRKYIFDLEKPVVAKPLPEDLKWGTVRKEDFALVRSRTQIPRQDRTLAKLPSIAIYPTDNSAPIAWAFLGYDASLTTLHVEEAYRGRGLAKALSGKLFAEGMSVYLEKNPEGVEERFGHADVAVDNGASKGVCGSLGGEWGFLVYWVRIDLGVV